MRKKTAILHFTKPPNLQEFRSETQQSPSPAPDKYSIQKRKKWTKALIPCEIFSKRKKMCCCCFHTWAALWWLNMNECVDIPSFCFSRSKRFTFNTWDWTHSSQRDLKTSLNTPETFTASFYSTLTVSSGTAGELDFESSAVNAAVLWRSYHPPTARCVPSASHSA